MSLDPPADEIASGPPLDRGASGVWDSPRDIPPEVFAQLDHLLFGVPGDLLCGGTSGLRKPLPENRDLLRILFDEAERVVAAAQAWLAERQRLKVAVHHGLGTEEIRAGLARLEQVVLPIPDLLVAYAPWTRAEALFFGAYLLRTGGPCSEHPDVAETLADEGLAATIRWVRDRAGVVHREAFSQLAATPAATTAEANAAARVAAEADAAEWVAASPGGERSGAPIVLGGPDDDVFVLGKRYGPLPRAQYRVLKAIVEAHATGQRLSKDALSNRTKDERGHCVDDPVGALKRLLRRHPDWADVLSMADVPGRGYGLKDRPPTPT